MSSGELKRDRGRGLSVGGCSVLPSDESVICMRQTRSLSGVTRTDGDVTYTPWECACGNAAMVGEGSQRKGRRGALLAKRWLDRSTRVATDLVNPDGTAEKKLTLKKANYQNTQDVISFDLGGRFRDKNGIYEGHYFLAECKNYDDGSDLGAEYRSFLAHCYRAVAIEHFMADQFFWIAFAPHGVTKWDKLTSADEVKKAVLHTAERNVNFKPDDNAEDLFSVEVADKVSERLWLVILSEKQIEHLSLTKEHLGVIEKYIVESASEALL